MDAPHRHIVITGASGGLGHALCAEFAAPGVLLGLHYAHNEAGVQTAVEAASERGAETYRVCADFASDTETDRAVREIAALGPEIDVLVLNAGAVHEALLVRTVERDWTRVIDINLRAPVRVSEQLFESMRHPDGHIVVLGSLVGLRGHAGLAAYAAAKGALAGYVRDAAVRFGARGVSINAIIPGILHTPMTAHMQPDLYAHMCGENVLGRPSDCAEAARAVRMLTELRHMSGQVVSIDSRPWPESARVIGFGEMP